MNDIRFAFRQLRKSPGFALTVILTVALGIGANTAIFSLVHAVLMKSLPVVDPKTLYRVGDKDDCCVSGGYLNDEGDFDLFSYRLYEHFRDNAPEFEQLAAMQAGGNTLTVRRGSEPAKAQRSEFVSGNYFTHFRHRSVRRPGPDDGRTTPRGSAPVAMMSYQAWQSDYGGDSGIVGSTVYIQTQPVTIVGIAPPGFFGDRIRENPPAFWIPLAVEPLINQKNSLRDIPDSNWLYVLGTGETGRRPMGPLQAKMSNSLRVWLGTAEDLHRERRFHAHPQAACGDRAGGRGDPAIAAGDRQGTLPADGALRTGAAGGMRQHRQSAAGARRNSQGGDLDPHGAGSGAEPADPADADGEPAAGLYRRPGGPGRGVCRDADHSVAGLSQLAAVADPCQSVAAGAGIRLSAVAGDGSGVRHCSGVDHLALRSGRSAARSESLHPRPYFAAAEVADRVSGCAVTGVAGRRRIADAGRCAIWSTRTSAFRRRTATCCTWIRQVRATPRRSCPRCTRRWSSDSAHCREWRALAWRCTARWKATTGAKAFGWRDVLRQVRMSTMGSSWDRVSPKFFETVGQPVIRGRGFTDADTATSQTGGGGQSVVRQEVLSQAKTRSDGTSASLTRSMPGRSRLSASWPMRSTAIRGRRCGRCTSAR